MKLWVEERELEALKDSASAEVRRDLEREIQRLRELVQSLRAEAGANPAQPQPKRS